MPPRQASQPRLADASPARAGQPLVRFQKDDPARPVALQMPSPAELGLGPRPKVEVDWVDVRRRLQALQVTSFHLQKLPDGGFRFSCVVPTGQGTRKVEAEADAEADAITHALNKADALKQ